MSPEIVSHTSLILTLLVVGGVGGFLSGMLGVGGGVIFVPALYFTLTSFAPEAGHIMRVAIGTSTALILVTGTSSSFWHHKKGAVDFVLLKSWSPAIVAGVVVGTYFASTVNGHFLKQLFASLMLLISVYMALSKEPHADARARFVSAYIQKSFAAFVGMIAALLGVGGAILNIPFMTYMMGMPIRKAVGTSSALALVISFPAMVGYIFSGLRYAQELPPYCIGYVNWMALIVILPVSMLLSPVGVYVSHKLPKNVLRRIFAVVLALVSLRMFMS
jgi:uncharacterized membrane protein YfcA